MTCAKKVLLTFAILMMCFAVPVFAGQPKNCLIEDMTATWCQYCPNARCGCETMQSTYPNNEIYVSMHCSSTDPYDIPAADARASWYGLTGYPTVQSDGKYQDVGDYGSCPACFNQYQNRFNTRMTETGGVSPVAITNAFFVFGTGSSGEMTAQFTLQDAATLGAVQATFFVLEDSLTWCCGYSGVNHWDNVTRIIQNVTVTNLVHVGDTVTLTENIALDPTWNHNALKGIVVLQQTTTPKAIIQSMRLTHVSDFALDIPAKVQSVPDGNGTATFPGSLTNQGTATDTYTISASTIGGWAASFQLAGDPNWYTSTTINLAAGATRGLTLQAATDGTKEIGTATLNIHAASTGRSEPDNVTIYNGSYAILLVDDDNGHQTSGINDEMPFVNGLTGLGYLYNHWDVTNGHGGASPAFSDANGFDAVVWETSYITSNPLTTDEITSMEQYVDNGGRLYLNSMDFLSTVTNPNPFVNNYLGVATWVNNTKSNTASGVSGDPITDGLVLPLTFPVSSANRVDTVNPGSGASSIFFSETGNSNAVRYQPTSNSKVVFSTIIHNAFSQSAPDPNNSQTVLGRILTWLLPQRTSSVPVHAPSLASGFAGVHPNPFSPQTTLNFNLSPRAAQGPVRLTLVDVTGRAIRTLVNGPLAAGSHTAAWDGRDDNSRLVPSGIYFARLKSSDGESSTKMVLAR